MLRIDKANKALIALEPKTMRESGYWERRDIQEMICRSPVPFCEELGEEIHIIGSEAHPTDFVQDRIDLLAVDPDGGAVIIEIKRDSHKLHLLQALSYAGMVAKWEPKQFIEELCRFNKSDRQTFEQAKDQLEEILEEGDIEAINRNQRIVLLAEAFDYEVLVTAEWLTERYDVDIRCYRVALAKNGDDDFLTCTRAYPPPELTDIAIRRRQKKEIGAEASTNWDGALKFVENPAVVKFFRQELSAGRPNNVKRRALRFFIGDRRRFIVLAKRKWARVWQSGRFDDDVEFWTSRLGDGAKVKPIWDGRALRFYLFDEAMLDKFKQAASVELANTEFQHSSDACTSSGYPEVGEYIAISPDIVDEGRRLGAPSILVRVIGLSPSSTRTPLEQPHGAKGAGPIGQCRFPGPWSMRTEGAPYEQGCGSARCWSSADRRARRR